MNAKTIYMKETPKSELDMKFDSLEAKDFILQHLILWYLRQKLRLSQFHKGNGESIIFFAFSQTKTVEITLLFIQTLISCPVTIFHSFQSPENENELNFPLHLRISSLLGTNYKVTLSILYTEYTPIN